MVVIYAQGFAALINPAANSTNKILLYQQFSIPLQRHPMQTFNLLIALHLIKHAVFLQLFYALLVVG